MIELFLLLCTRRRRRTHRIDHTYSVLYIFLVIWNYIIYSKTFIVCYKFMVLMRYLKKKKITTNYLRKKSSLFKVNYDVTFSKLYEFRKLYFQETVLIGTI